MGYRKPTLAGFRSPGRTAFTMIELLLVITIILVLISLSVPAVFKLIGWTNYRATERTLTRVHDKLNRQLEALRKDAAKAELFSYAYALANDGDPANEGKRKERAKVIQNKMLLKWYFPMSYEEARLNFAESKTVTDQFGRTLYAEGHPIARAIYQNLLNKMAVKTVPHPPATFAQNGACLLAIYEVAGGKSDDFTSAEFQDTDSDGVGELVDAFATPFLFYRNSTAPAFYLLRAQAAYPGKAYDIDDPDGLLVDTVWLNYANSAFGNQSNRDVFKAKFGHDPATPFYLPLLVVSAGVNGGPTAANYGFGDADDMDSYRLKLSVTGSQ